MLNGQKSDASHTEGNDKHDHWYPIEHLDSRIWINAIRKQNYFVKECVKLNITY